MQLHLFRFLLILFLAINLCAFLSQNLIFQNQNIKSNKTDKIPERWNYYEEPCPYAQQPEGTSDGRCKVVAALY